MGLDVVDLPIGNRLVVITNAGEAGWVDRGGFARLKPGLPGLDFGITRGSLDLPPARYLTGVLAKCGCQGVPGKRH
jgi:hypothetical protein